MAAGLGLFVALIIFGARYHWVEEAGSAERDGYVAEAEQILHGDLPRDPFRPLLYPLATAALARLFGHAFACARLLSNLAAAGLALAAFGMGRRIRGGAAAGGWAMALVAVNPNLWILGQHVTTDMPFAALAAATLLAALAYLQAPSRSKAILAGALFALAVFTRGNAVFLLPGLLAAWWLAGSGKRRIQDVCWAGMAAALVLAPHWLLRWQTFGDPFHDENWKNLIWKLHGYPDWSALDRIPAGGGFYSTLRTEPWTVLTAASAETWRFLREGLPQLLGTWVHVAALVLGTVLVLRVHRRGAGWLLLTATIFTAGVATVFFTWGRFLLLLLPIAAAITFAGVVAMATETSAPWSWRPSYRFTPLVGLALVALLALKTFAFRLPAFIARHPYAAVAELRRLDASLPSGQSLAGTPPFLGRYLLHPYVAIPDAFGPEIQDPSLYYAKLWPLLRSSHVAYLVIPSIDLRDRPRALLGEGPAPNGLELVAHQGQMTTWRVSALEPIPKSFK